MLVYTYVIQPVYDLIAIGSGAGGLVSAKQSARRNAKSAMISEKLAGGDCLNVGCVPSKSLLHVAKTIQTIQKQSRLSSLSSSSHSSSGSISSYFTTPLIMPAIDFTNIMKRLRYIREQISPVDGHEATINTGAHVYQGRGIFTSPNTIQVIDRTSNTIIVPELKFKKAVIATGGKPYVPKTIPGLLEAPYTTNESIFNLQTLPERIIIIGSGYVALEMAYCFSIFGSQVTIIQRTDYIFQSKDGDYDSSLIIQQTLENLGVVFLSQTSIERVDTIRYPTSDNEHPLIQVTVASSSSKDSNADSASATTTALECDCLLVATGRKPNVDNLGLDKATVDYDSSRGIYINDFGQSISNNNIYAVGDCVADMPRLTHVAGEMAKLIIQNSLFNDTWKVSSLVIPAVMYTSPEYATVGIYSLELANSHNIPVDVYCTTLEHNDRAICEQDEIITRDTDSNSRSDNDNSETFATSTSASMKHQKVYGGGGLCKIICRKDTDTILGCTIVAERAGEIINEVTLAMKNNIGLYNIGRNIHSYPTTGEIVMSCGIQYINSKWKKL